MKERKETLHGAIYNDIMARIRSGELKVGDKLPTEIEMTRQYGVSRITVARALRDLAEINLVYRVKKAGTFVNGKLNYKNLQLIIPVILPFPESFNGIAKGIESVTLANNIFMPFYNTKNNLLRERTYLSEILRNNLDGLIVYPCSSYENIDLYAQILARGIPIVCIDRNIEGLETPLVTTTNAKCMEQIVDRLAQLGHTAIGYYALSDRPILTETERFKGFCKGLIQNKLPLRREYIFDNPDIHKREVRLTQVKQARMYRSLTLDCVSKLLSLPEKPTAICCINDSALKELYQSVTAAGVDVPRRLMLAGFDCIDEDWVRSCGFISVRQNFYALGLTAMKLMLQILDGKPYPLLESVDGILVG